MGNSCECGCGEETGDIDFAYHSIFDTITRKDLNIEEWSFSAFVEENSGSADNHLYLRLLIHGYIKHMMIINHHIINDRTHGRYIHIPLPILQIIFCFFPLSIVRLQKRLMNNLHLFVKTLTNNDKNDILTNETNEIYINTKYLLINDIQHCYKSLFYSKKQLLKNANKSKKIKRTIYHKNIQKYKEFNINLHEICNLFPYHSKMCIFVENIAYINLDLILHDLRKLQYKYIIEIHFPTFNSLSAKSDLQSLSEYIKEISAKYQRIGWRMQLTDIELYMYTDFVAAQTKMPKILEIGNGSVSYEETIVYDQSKVFSDTTTTNIIFQENTFEMNVNYHRFMKNNTQMQKRIIFRKGYFGMYAFGTFVMNDMSENTVRKMWDKLGSDGDQCFINKENLSRILLFCAYLFYAYLAKKKVIGGGGMDKRASRKSLTPVCKWIMGNCLGGKFKKSLKGHEFHKLGEWLHAYHARRR